MGEKRRNRKYRRIRADSGQQRRIGLVMAVLGAAAFLPVGIRLWGLMVSSYDTWSALALSNQSRSTQVQSARGTIYDRNWNILAVSETVEHLYIAPRELQQSGADIDGLASALGEILGVEPDRVKKLAQDRSLRYHLIQAEVEAEAAARVRSYIEESGTRGVHLEPNSRRSSDSPTPPARGLRVSKRAMNATSPERRAGQLPPRATTRWICPSPWSAIYRARQEPTW